MNHTRDKKKKKVAYEEEQVLPPQELEEEEADTTKPKECLGFCARCHTSQLLKEIRNNILIYLNAGNKRQMEAAMEEKLDEAEIFLREFMDKKGMLMKESKTSMERFQYG